MHEKVSFEEFFTVGGTKQFLSVAFSEGGDAILHVADQKTVADKSLRQLLDEVPVTELLPSTREETVATIGEGRIRVAHACRREAANYMLVSEAMSDRLKQSGIDMELYPSLKLIATNDVAVDEMIMVYTSMYQGNIVDGPFVISDKLYLNDFWQNYVLRFVAK